MTPQEQRRLIPGWMRERMEHLIADHQAALARQEDVSTHETIIDVLHEVAAGRIWAGQAIRILAAYATRVKDEPEQGALYRAALADLAHIVERELST